jgi:UDP-glucose 4-epimerase
MRAVITGGAGFIGSHLAERLLADGHRVTVLDDLSTGSYHNIEHLLKRADFEFVLGSICNADVVDDVAARSDAVFHLAAAVGVQLIVEQPLESLMTNVRGSEVVMEKAHKHGCRVLVTSTSEIYGKNTSDRLTESDDRILGTPLKTRWSYSTCKALEETLAHAYYREKGVESVIARLFNTVGPRQTGYYGMVVPRFVGQALRGEPVTVYGTGQQTRCFCYVGDVIDALVRLIDQPQAYGEVFNLGATEEVSIEELAHRVIARAGSASKIRYVPYDEAYEEGFEDMQRRVPDTTRAAAYVGFEPTVDLDGIIDAVIEHQRA